MSFFARVARRPLIWVEGIIGCGKSTFCDEIGKRLELLVMKEPVDANPYLARFYENPQRWAWPMQVHLLMERYNMQRAAASVASGALPEYRGAILDRSISGDRVFCKLHYESGNISELEWRTYERAYLIMAQSLLPPTTVIFLDCAPETAYERVQRRMDEKGGVRKSEVAVDLEYLRKLRDGYFALWQEAKRGLLPWGHAVDITTFHWDPVNDKPDWDRHAQSIAHLCEAASAS